MGDMHRFVIQRYRSQEYVGEFEGARTPPSLSHTPLGAFESSLYLCLQALYWYTCCCVCYSDVELAY